jgi:hypothetical protein
MYANTPNTIATTDLVYQSNIFTVAGSSRIVAESVTSFTDFSNGGAITSFR